MNHPLQMSQGRHVLLHYKAGHKWRHADDISKAAMIYVIEKAKKWHQSKIDICVRHWKPPIKDDGKAAVISARDHLTKDPIFWSCVM